MKIDDESRVHTQHMVFVDFNPILKDNVINVSFY